MSPPVLSALARRLSVSLALSFAASAAALAAPSAATFAPAPHAQHAARPEARPPRPAPELYRTDYDDPASVRAQVTAHLPRHAAALTAAVAACDTNAFAGATPSTIASVVRGASTDCVNQLFSLTGTAARDTFGEAKMVAVANALKTYAASYPGDNSTSVQQLVLFLRAGYFVQFYDSADVGTYGASLAGAIRPALDTFIANAHFNDVNDNHGAVLAEFVTLIDSSSNNANEIPALKSLLARYQQSWNSYWYMRNAVNGVYTVLWRGHDMPAFQAAIKADKSITDTLASFVGRTTFNLNTDSEFVTDNAAAELGRFLDTAAYGTTVRDYVRPKIRTIVTSYPMVGTGQYLFVAAAGQADAYDAANCSYYGLCDFKNRLAAAVLPVSYTCSSTLKLRAQALTSAQVTDTCSTVGGEEGYFHTKLATNRTPLPNDYNTSLEMVVFHSSADYAAYSYLLFGNDTNNGGIYEEGDPSVPGNLARFYCYEAEWLRPTFQIWNLTHEYIHYLDGRFDMAGNFGDYPLTAPYSAVWYIEGVAEYLSYSYRNVVYDTAVSAAAAKTWKLSTLFDTVYGTDYARTYQGGYLATRFMFENHSPDVTRMLGLFRAGNYGPGGYQGFLNGVRTAYDAQFSTWLGCLAAHNGDTSTCNATQPPSGECTGADARALGKNCTRSNLSVATTGGNYYLYLWVPSGAKNLKISTSGGTGDVDLYVGANFWPGTSNYTAASRASGNVDSVSIASPAGNTYYYVTLYAYAPFAGVTVKAEYQ